MNAFVIAKKNLEFLDTYLDEPFSAFADLLQNAIIKQTDLESVSKG